MKSGIATPMIIYFLIAIVSAVVNEFGSLDQATLAKMCWTNWVVVIGKILTPGLVTLKAFFNTAVADAKQQNDSNNEPAK